MTNPPKRKGSAAETALLRCLHGQNFDAVRNPPAGSNDVGDLTVFDRSDVGDQRRCWCERCGNLHQSTGTHITVEVKNCKNVATAIREGLKELDVEKANAGTDSGVLVVKPPGVGLDRSGDWYAIRRVKDDPEIGAA